MTCKYRYADWCHKPPEDKEQLQELCYFFCYGKEEDCSEYEEKKQEF